jgi:hypothetical protein
MKKNLICIFFFLQISWLAAAQPGYSLAALQFRVFYNGEDFIQRSEKDIVLEWHNSKNGTWQKALVQNGEFVTGAVDAHRNPAAIKIYRLGKRDTMFISTSRSLHQIPFQPGQFVFDHHTAPLANMKTFSATVIRNQQWKYFRTSATDTLPLLLKHRYVYVNKDLFPQDIETPIEPGVVYNGFQSSEHIKATEEDGYEMYMELGQLYYAPALSSSVYCIGYLDDQHKEEQDYRPWLLESKDGCRSWSIRFALQETDAQLANISNRGFVFLRENETTAFITYDTFGNVIDSLGTEDPCNSSQNIFPSCDTDTKFSTLQGVESSSPHKSAHSSTHFFHRRFTSDGVHFISMDGLPFHPNDISHAASDGSEQKILELNAGDTYAYLTVRKNKVVAVSYDYTLVSNDFGNSWTYYRNGLLDSGNWNFIWLDDNTLVNVTQEYADVISIE